MTKLRLILPIAIFLLAIIPLHAQGPPRRTVYESKCGSEIPWLEDFEEAAALAKKEKKPIFWFVPTSYRTPMDRRQELYWNMMAGPFSDPVVVDYIKERYIPLKVGFRSLLRRGSMIKLGSRELAEKYGLVQGKFIEPGFVLLSPKGKLVHTVDRCLLFQRKWFLSRMERIGAANKSALKYTPMALPEVKKTSVQEARDALGKGEVQAATSMLAKIGKKSADFGEAQWLLGVCHHMQNETSKANGIWSALSKSQAESNWGRKAKAELDGWGPFLYGFESYRDFPKRVMAHKDLRHSRVAGFHQDEAEMVSRGLDRLFELQTRRRLLV